MNTVTVVGRLGADPEVKYGDDGRAITSFSVADDQGKDKQGAERTNWFRCTAWGKTAENIGNFFSKGGMIAVTGQLLAREFTGNDGKNRTSLDLTVDRFGFCGDAKQSGQQPQAAAPAPQPSRPAAPAPAPNYGPPPQGYAPQPGPFPVAGPAPNYGPPAAQPVQPQLPQPPPGYRWANTPQGPIMVPIQPGGNTLPPDEIPF